MNKIKLFSITVLLFVCNLQAAELKPYTGSMQAVDFTLKDLNGKTHQLSSYKGKVVLVNFWATWCPPCIKELPSLLRLQKHYKDKPVAILTIDVGEPKKLITPFLEQLNVTELTVLMDHDGKSHKDWNIYVFPSNFLLDKSGKINHAAIGALEWDDQEVIKIIDKLIE